jgi:DNA invertase Pin-like site-specific DNA recombinase
MNYGNLALKQVTTDSDLMNIKSYVPNEADIGRRVLCLYRVSTDKQVTYNERDEADIPMQRQTGRRFLEQQGWVLVHEEREDGISGHKVRAEKRDSIQYIKELALTEKFDILLVFMFDRIGRIADETPFVVEWLIKHGIRVWSVNEGEQRLDTHTDKLMNYIRFWKAEGESDKTAIRTKAGLSVLVESGHYKGGNAPYGYTLVKSGRLDKKGNEKKNLSILEEEAVIVRKIFDLYVRHGYGVHKIANTLTAEGIKTRAGKNFHHASINAMIRNLTYTGVLRSGETRSKLIPELQIITPELHSKAQDILKKRNTDAADKRTYPMNTDSRCLLNGKVYCADCGSRLIVATNGKYIYENGEKLKRLRYMCYGKSRKQTDCHGQTGYTVSRLDGVVDGVIRHIFESMRSIPKSEVVNSGLTAVQKEHESRYKAAQREYTKAAADLAELKAEVLKAIRGMSKFTPELLNELIAEGEKGLAEVEAARNAAKQELDGCKFRAEEMQAQYDEVISWTDLYDAADLAAKKMIVANLINRVEVGTDYDIHIDFNIDLSHFNIQLDIATAGQRETA